MHRSMKSRYARFHGDRQQQLETLRRQGYTVIQIKTAPVVIAYKDSGTSIWVKAWKNKAAKPDLHLWFTSMERAQKYMADYVTRAGQVASYKTDLVEKRKAARAALKASDHWSVGDVLYNSWGYEQTNIDWYQVVAVKAKSVVIRAVCKNFGATGWLQGRSQPRRNEFCGEPLIKPLDESGRISMRHGAATKWDGRPVSESSYH